MNVRGRETPEVQAHLDRSRRRAVRALLPGGLSGLDTLELGCGSGDFIGLLVAEGLDAARLEGIDRNPDRVADAASRFPAARFRTADLRALELGRECVDLVVLSQVLSQLPEGGGRRDLLALAAAVLRPRGRVLIHDMLIIRPRSRKLGLKRFGPSELARVMPEGFTMRDFRRCTLLPPLLRLTARSVPALSERLEALTMLRGHWMTLLERKDSA